MIAICEFPRKEYLLIERNVTNVPWMSKALKTIRRRSLSPTTARYKHPSRRGQNLVQVLTKVVIVVARLVN